MAICAQQGLEVTEADYKTAYLNAKLDTKIYMKQAPGFPAIDENGNEIRGPNGEEMVCQLDRAIYGLVQSALKWEQEHHGTLINDLGWEQCSGEACLFRKVFNGITCYICTYVDNVFMGFPPGSKDKQHLLELLGKKYVITDLGPVAYSLGARVIQQPRIRQTVIHQKPSIDEICKQYYEEIKSSGETHKMRTTPCDPSIMEIIKSDPDSQDVKDWKHKCLDLPRMYGTD